jgi:hypothetical protein
VRVSGGLGFWRIDEAALSWQMPFDAELRRIAPASARDPAGRDWREALRAVDGTSQLLGDRGDRLDLSFELPPIPAGRTRTAFLFTHGYYNVHRPPEGNWSPLTLKTIRDRPGALAAFGLDLLRLHAAGRRGAGSVTGERPAVTSWPTTRVAILVTTWLVLSIRSPFRVAVNGLEGPGEGVGDEGDQLV